MVRGMNHRVACTAAQDGVVAAGRGTRRRLLRDTALQPRAAVLAVVILAVLVIAVATAAALPGADTTVLVISAAQDTSRVFGALTISGQATRALFWPEGVLTTPETMIWRAAGPDGLAFDLRTAALGGVSTGGRFALQPGRYDLDVPLLLSDGAVTVALTAGRLEVAPGRITYSRPPARRDPRGDYYILAGLILATAILLRAARRRSGRGNRDGGRSARRPRP
jgi:hypothetical protein